MIELRLVPVHDTPPPSPAVTVLVSPEWITAVTQGYDGSGHTGTIVHTKGGNYTVYETPWDVARLRAAWERRLAIQDVDQEELVIGLKMENDGITAVLCEYTAAEISANAAEAAERRRLRERVSQ